MSKFALQYEYKDTSAISVFTMWIKGIMLPVQTVWLIVF